jgi:hypothetical protein
VDRLRGGRKRVRDRLYGLEDREGAEEFRRWWHREGKPSNGDRDLVDKDDAERWWDQWVAEGCPTVKLGVDHGE